MTGLLTRKENDYEAQVEQVPPEQLEQEWPLAPGTAWGTPLTLVLMAEKTDILRAADLWHWGHSAGSAQRLTFRISSNL
jgi:hypothetical protein